MKKIINGFLFIWAYSILALTIAIWQDWVTLSQIWHFLKSIGS